MSPSNRAALFVILLVLLMFLAACSQIPTLTTVKVAVPVPCQEQVPERPVMPTEALKGQKPTIYEAIQAARAEITVREAYENRLRTALLGCTEAK